MYVKLAEPLICLLQALSLQGDANVGNSRYLICNDPTKAESNVGELSLVDL